MAGTGPLVPRVDLDWDFFTTHQAAKREIEAQIEEILVTVARGGTLDSIAPPVVLCSRDSVGAPEELGRFVLLVVDYNNRQVRGLKRAINYGARLAICTPSASSAQTLGVAHSSYDQAEFLGDYNGKPAVAVRVYPPFRMPAVLFMGLIEDSLGRATLTRLPTVGVDPDNGTEALAVGAITEPELYGRFGGTIPIAEAPIV
jgi:hypothetical protein